MQKLKKSRENQQHRLDYSKAYPRPKLLWLAKPEPIRNALMLAYNRALNQVKPYLEKWFETVEADAIVKTFLYSLLLSRLRQLLTNTTKSDKRGRASPLSLMRSYSFWLDEFGCPEEAVWLTMTVPARVWFWLVVDEYKRKRFFDAVREIFPDEIPMMEVDGHA